jgi:hypothetical protein
MKRLIITALLIIDLLLPGVVAFASDITDAQYETVITVTNNSTTDYSGIAGNLILSVPDMISNGMLNASGSDVTIQRSGAVDVPFMPGYSTNPWCVFVPTSYSQTVQNYNMYHGGVTGGPIRYFPDTPGMTITDDATLEPGNIFKYTFKNIYLNTDNGTDKHLLYKGDAIDVYTSNTTSGNITAALFGWITPTGHIDAAATWANDANAYDGNTGTRADTVGAAPAYSDYLVLTFQATVIDSIRVWAIEDANHGPIDVDWYDNGNWYNAYEGNAVHLNWTTIDLASNVTATAVRFRQKADIGTPSIQLYEVAVFGQTAHATVTGISSGEYDMTVSANTTHLILTVGAATNSTVLGGASVPDNANDWYLFENDSVMYAGKTTVDIAGVPVSAWEWEYGATFADSIGANDATPSFRTAGSTADVILSIASQDSTAEQGEPYVATGGGWGMIDAVPTAPGELFTEGGTTFPGYAEIDAFATGTRMISTQGLLYIIAFVTSGMGLLGVFAKTHNSKMGNKGSLFLGCFTAEVILMVWVFAGGGVISGLVLIPFGLISILWLLIRNPFSPITS